MNYAFKAEDDFLHKYDFNKDFSYTDLSKLANGHIGEPILVNVYAGENFICKRKRTVFKIKERYFQIDTNECYGKIYFEKPFEVIPYEKSIVEYMPK